MAIIVEERSNAASILSVFIWLLILAGIGAGIYYLFFEKPALIEVAVPAGFESAQQISQIELNPQEVISDDQFRALRQYVTVPATSTIGRQNPFLGF